MKKETTFLKRIAMATVACLSLYSFAEAQTNLSDRNSNNQSPVSIARTDTGFISQWIRENVMEIRVARLGIDKGTNALVRKQAEQTIKDHQQMLNELTVLGKRMKMNITDADTAVHSWISQGMEETDHSNISNGQGTGNLGSRGNQPGKSASTMGRGTNNGATDIGKVKDDTTIAGRSPSANDNTTETANSQIGTRNTSRFSDTTLSSATNRQDTALYSTGTLNVGNRKNNNDVNGQQNVNDKMVDVDAIAALNTANGEQFDALWVAQMLAMHQRKLSVLEAHASRLKDPELKRIINSAIPKVRLHRDALLQMRETINPQNVETNNSSGSESKIQ